MELRHQISGTSAGCFAPEFLIDCSKTNNGCGGGYLDNAWKFLVSEGVPEEKCDPYLHGPNAPSSGNHACPKKCKDGSAIKTYKAKSAYAVGKVGDVAAIQKEIMTNGPVEVAFFVFSDFMSYRSGIYKRSASSGDVVGGHAVKAIGWGTENATAYWLIANSWGAGFGEKGFFRIARGTNECGIETTVAAGMAAAL